jgi:hypothetical protein
MAAALTAAAFGEQTPGHVSLRNSIRAGCRRQAVREDTDAQRHTGSVAPINKESAMTLCPIALVAGCKKCPAFTVCPLKGVLGDQKPAESGKASAPADGDRK